MKKRFCGQNGVSLLEVMIVVAILGTIASFALPRIGGIKGDVEEVKLLSDVATLNSAVKVYLSNGGSIPSSASAEEVIEKVGRSVSPDQADTFVGFTGSMVDNRLSVQWLPDGKVSTGRARAVWDSALKRFTVTKNPVAGIASFRTAETSVKETGNKVDLTTSNEAGIEDDGPRSSMRYASETNWVWDYTEVAVAGSSGPTEFPVTPVPGDSAPPSNVPPTPVPSGPARLSPPVFSVPPGTYPLGDFKMPLTLSNPNAAGTSVIYAQRPGQPWFEYTPGTEFTLQPGEQIQAMAMSLDPAIYSASDVVGGDYDADPLRLALRMISNSSTVTYWDIIDSDTLVDLRVPNVWRVPDFLREPGLFDTYYTANGADPRFSSGANHIGTYDGLSNRSAVRLDPSFWEDGTRSLELKAFAKSSIEELVGSSTVTTTTINAESLELAPPLISMVEQDAGAQMVSLELAGRYPPGTRIFYNTSGDPPSYDPATGQILNGTEYVAPFLLQPNLEGDSTGTTGSVDIGNGMNDVKITNVTLETEGQTISQDQSHYFDVLDNPGFDGMRDNEVVDRSNSRIELKSITIRQDGRTIVADNVNVLDVTVKNLNFPADAQDNDVTVKREGQIVANLSDRSVSNGPGNGDDDDGGNKSKGKAKGKGPQGDTRLAFEIAQTLSSTNLRDYVDYAGGTSERMSKSDFDFDVTFSPLTNNDFLVVMERFGNSTFDLRALDANGEVISGSNRLTFREYSWNTGYAPSDTGGQSMFFSVIDIEKFNVDTDLNSIAGFKVNNDGGADFKFFTLSDDTFEDREVRYTGEIQAVAIPPQGLEIWFDPSQVASREVEGTTTVSSAP